MSRQITYAQCKTMTDHILEKAARAQRPLAVVVTDDAGNIVSATLMDGFHVRGIAFAHSKAYTAAKMTRTGREFRKLLEEGGNTLAAFCDPMMTNLIGSSPVWDKQGQVIGAIAVSGWTSDEDQQLCDEAVKLV